jgi:hypothetical protein
MDQLSIVYFFEGQDQLNKILHAVFFDERGG